MAESLEQELKGINLRRESRIGYLWAKRRIALIALRVRLRCIDVSAKSDQTMRTYDVSLACEFRRLQK